MPGPTLVDLRERLGVNYEQISQALLAKGIGSIGGAILGGFINEKFYHHLDFSMFVCLCLIAIAAVVIPLSGELGLTAAMFALNGLAEGIINTGEISGVAFIPIINASFLFLFFFSFTGGNTMVMHLWGEDASSPMNSLHFGFGFGALIAPQIARPFLSPDALDDDDDPLTTLPHETTTTWGNMTAAPSEDESRIEIPYIIAACGITLFAFVLLAFYFKGPPEGFKLHEPKTKFREMISPGSCADGHVCFGVQILCALFFYYIQAVGGERAYGKFLFSFAVDSDIKMKKSVASNLQTAFWASFTAGRLSGVLIGKFVPLRYVMIANVVGNVITATFLVIYAQEEVLVLWILTCVFGVLISIVFPNGMSWANLHLDMNSMAVMILVIGAGCGDFAYNYLTGFLFDKDPQNLMYVMLGYSLLLVLVYAVMEILALIHGKHFKALKIHEMGVITHNVESKFISNAASANNNFGQS